MTIEQIIKVAKKIFLRWQLNGFINENKYKISVKPDFDTACWYIARNFYNELVNHIEIGDKALDLSNDYSSKERLISNLMHHELGHSRFTTQNLNFVESQCRSIKVPFSLFNLFEDVRMENLVRDKFEHRFHWFSFIKPKYMGFGSCKPEALLLALKNGEAIINKGNEKLCVDAFVNEYVSKNEDPMSMIKAFEIASRISEYYYPAIMKCKDALDLFPLLKEWRDEFSTNENKAHDEIIERIKEIIQEIKEHMKENGEGSCSLPMGIKELEDLTQSKDLSENPSKAKEFNKNSVHAAGNSREKEDIESKSNKLEKDDKLNSGDKRDDVDLNTVTVEDFSNGNLLYDRNDGEYDRTMVNKLYPKFEKFVKSKNIKVSSKKPSRRLHSRNLILKKENIYKHKLETGQGKRVLSCVVDCSGSMGSIMPKMRVVIALVNRLCTLKNIHGYLMLSSSREYHTIKLPMNPDDIDKIHGFSGSEGLNNTMMHNIELLTKSSHVFVLTDGDICDDPIDKDSLRRRNINPIGLYLGKRARNLSLWFDRYINRETEEELIDELVRKIK